MPKRETLSGVTHIRVRGFDHTRFLKINLLLDLIWGIRVAMALPKGDVVISNTVSLPVWLRSLKPSAGKIVVSLGRLPKGQIPFYRHVSRIYAPTRVVAKRIASEWATAGALTRIVGYPIDWEMLRSASAQNGNPVVIGFVGRLNPEKGIELLLRASIVLAQRAGLPDWRLVLVGPVSVNDGGGGESWITSLESEFGPRLGGQLVREGPEFDPKRLASKYGSMDIFCYPSLSDTGETFGVSIAEAMASGCAAVVSSLECFNDLVTDGKTGLVFDHRQADSPERLADCLGSLIVDAGRRRTIAAEGQLHVRQFDYPQVARIILEDLSDLTGADRKNGNNAPMTREDPFLGQGCSTPYTHGENASRLLWAVVQATLFRLSPRPWHAFRARLLRAFGANIPEPGKVVIFPTASVVFPARLSLAPRSMIGPNVSVYNLATISLLRGANVSQNCHLCAGTHDYLRWSMSLVAKPITIGENSWLGADVFVGPGVSIGELCVVGARSVVVKDLPSHTVCAGNPCRVLKERPPPSA